MVAIRHRSLKHNQYAFMLFVHHSTLLYMLVLWGFFLFEIKIAMNYTLTGWQMVVIQKASGGFNVLRVSPDWRQRSSTAQHVKHHV